MVQRHAQPILTRALEILQSTPSLPTYVKPLALNLAGESGPLGDHAPYVIHRGLLDVAYALIILLPPPRDTPVYEPTEELAGKPPGWRTTW